MNTTTTKRFFAGLAIYSVCIGLGALPIFSSAMSLAAVLELCVAAAAASVLVAAIRYSRMHRYLKDPAGMFTQAVLGIGICSGLYSVVSSESRPEVMFMAFLLWTATGLMHLTPSRVGILFALNLGIFLNAFSSDLLLATGTQLDAEAIFMLLASALMAGFMYWRAREYTRVRNEKARLRDENTQQSEQLKEAEARIHAITIQDLDSIALKYPFFKGALAREKVRADREGGTFSIGLVAIDHFAEIRALYGEQVAKQLLREFADRTTKLIRNMDFLDATDDSYNPLGRVGEGLSGLLLPGANLKGAKHCVQRLSTAMEYRDIRTVVGPISVTLSIGVVEYVQGEDVDELMSQLGRSLEKARLNHASGLQAAEQPQASLAPLKGARSSQEMDLLAYKDYSRPVH